MSMPSEEKYDELEKTQQELAQLFSELPRADGSIGKEVYLYQGSWLDPDVMFGPILMQNHFKHRPTDIFLTSFIKSGTTWLKALMFTTLNRSRYDFTDHPLIRTGTHECIPFIDFYKAEDYAIEEVHSSPRLFATHFAYNLLPSTVTDPSSGCKLVYVCRDPKDVLISMWHFFVKLRPKELPPLSLDQMFQRFCEGVIHYGPYWDHVLGYWEATVKSPSKLLFSKYEEIKRDPEGYVKKLAEFMGVPISVQEEENGMVKKIVEFCSLEHLTSLEINKSGNYKPINGLEIPNHAFFRRGEVGDWKCHLTQEMKDQIDRITLEKFKDSGLTFGATPK